MFEVNKMTQKDKDRIRAQIRALEQKQRNLSPKNIRRAIQLYDEISNLRSCLSTSW